MQHAVSYKVSQSNYFYNVLVYIILTIFITFIMLFNNITNATENISILNVSYDATRELYQEYNNMFTEYWQVKTGQYVTIKQSHGGSGKQARAVIDGIEADIVTLALAHDIDVIAQKTSLIDKQWQSRLPYNSAPYTSTIVFLVRKGNPKDIKDWEDLIKAGVSVITPNPKTSGAACWNYLAAWGYGLLKYDNNPEKAKHFVTNLYKNVVVLDSGARGATITFVERGIGDVLINWENEILLANKEFGKDKFDIIIPSVSILAEPPVTIVDKTVKKHNSKQIAEAYLEYLYSDKIQELIARHYFRPSNPEVAKNYHKQFSAIKLFTLKEIIGDWETAYKIHFAEGGIFDQIYQNK